MPTNIRDLVEGWDTRYDTDRSLVSVARENEHLTERACMPDPHDGIASRLPGGDPPHPLGGGVPNPMPGVSPLAMSRALRAGEIPFEQERAVRVYLDQFQKQGGGMLYDPRNHHAISQDQHDQRVYGDDTSLPTSVSMTRRTPGAVDDDDFNVEDIEF